MDKQKIKLTFKDWDYTCGDGCCYDYGTDVFVNGEEVSTHQSNLEQTLRDVLEHLGYEVEIEYEDEEK